MSSLKHQKFTTGFTVIELMIALTIAGVLLGFALPAFNDFTDQRRMAASANAFVLAMNYARSEAARLGGTVSVQAVDASDANNEWGAGFCVTAGNPGNCADPLQNFVVDGPISLDAIDALNSQGTLSFNSRGMLLNNLLGTIEMCFNEVGVDPGRSVNVNAVGRVSVVDLECYP